MNQIYPSFLQSLMEQFFKVDEPWTVDSLDVLLVGVGEGYTFDDSHHQVEDLGINVVFGPVPVPGVTLTNGVFAAGEIETSVEAEAGEVVHAVVLFAANDDGSQLLCYIDEGLPSQLPMTLLAGKVRSEEHTSELQSLMRISYAVFCLTKKLIEKDDNT